MMELDAAWAAGLFEGEGSIELTCRGGFNPRLAVIVSMSDEDVVRRLHRSVGYGTVHTILPREPHHKVQWRWRANNLHAGRFLGEIGHHLGERRRARANEALAQWHEGYSVRPGPWAKVQVEALKGVPQCV